MGARPRRQGACDIVFPGRPPPLHDAGIELFQVPIPQLPRRGDVHGVTKAVEICRIAIAASPAALAAFCSRRTFDMDRTRPVRRPVSNRVALFPARPTLRAARARSRPKHCTYGHPDAATQCVIAAAVDSFRARKPSPMRPNSFIFVTISCENRPKSLSDDEGLCANVL